MIEVRTIQEFLNIKNDMEETYILKNDLDFENVNIEVLVNSINTNITNANINNVNTYNNNINLAAQTENVESFLIQSLLDFTGILDGNNYKIKNLNFTGFSIFYKVSGVIKNLFFENCIIGDTTNYNGCCLLSCISENATFKNIYADNIKIIGCGYSYYYAAYYRNFLGGFCSLNFGNTSFNNCYLKVEFTTDYKGTKNIGGFLSYSIGNLTITNCYCNTIFTNKEQFKSTGLTHILGCLVAQLDYNTNLILNNIRCLSNINYNKTTTHSIIISNFIGIINNTSKKELVLKNIDIINNSSFLQDYENAHSFYGLCNYKGNNNIILKDIKNSGTVKTNYKYCFLSTSTTTNITINNFYSCLNLYINKYYRKSNTYLIGTGILNLKNVIFKNIITKYNTNTNIYYTNTNNNLISNTYSLINNGELDKDNINFLESINYNKIFTDSSNWNFDKTADLIIVYIKKNEVCIEKVLYKLKVKDNLYLNNIMYKVLNIYNSKQELVDYLDVKEDNINKLDYINKKNKQKELLCNGNIISFHNKLYKITNIYNKDKVLDKIELENNYKININYL